MDSSIPFWWLRNYCDFLWLLQHNHIKSLSLQSPTSPGGEMLKESMRRLSWPGCQHCLKWLSNLPTNPMRSWSWSSTWSENFPWSSHPGLSLFSSLNSNLNCSCFAHKPHSHTYHIDFWPHRHRHRSMTNDHTRHKLGLLQRSKLLCV